MVKRCKKCGTVHTVPASKCRICGGDLETMQVKQSKLFKK